MIYPYNPVFSIFKNVTMCVLDGTGALTTWAASPFPRTVCHNIHLFTFEIPSSSRISIKVFKRFGVLPIVMGASPVA